MIRHQWLSSSGEWNDDDYDVLADGVVVGRVFKANCIEFVKRTDYRLAPFPSSFDDQLERFHEDVSLEIQDHEMTLAVTSDPAFLKHVGNEQKMLRQHFMFRYDLFCCTRVKTNNPRLALNGIRQIWRQNPDWRLRRRWQGEETR